MLRGTTTDYYEADGLGSVTSITDSVGTVAETYKYDAYGNLIAGSTAVSNQFRYTGREWDGDADLYYYRARYYQVGLGRFLNEDPARFFAGVNFSEYANNNPTNYSDPSGLQTAPVLTSPPQLTVIIGGGGAALGSGPLVTGGAITLAGVAGWVTGRAIGHIPIGNGRTVDDAVTDMFARLWIQDSPKPTTQSPSNAKSCKRPNDDDDDDCGQQLARDMQRCAVEPPTPQQKAVCRKHAVVRYRLCEQAKRGSAIEIPPLTWWEGD
jgi:RHS repeat-associated protein